VFPSPIVLWVIVQLSLPPMYFRPTPPPSAWLLSSSVWLSEMVVSEIRFWLIPYLLEPSPSNPPTPAPEYLA